MSSKLREALEKVAKHIDRTLSILNEIPESCSHNGLVEDAADVLCAIKETYIPEALAEPHRNCDVGDAEEQFARFKKWCEGEFYKRPMNALTGEPCKSCPCYSVAANGVNGCNYLRWANMPYEKEGEE